jgi:hypothetical protein
MADVTNFIRSRISDVSIARVYADAALTLLLHTLLALSNIHTRFITL